MSNVPNGTKKLESCFNCKQLFSLAELEETQKDDRSPVEYYCSNCLNVLTLSDEEVMVDATK